MREAVMDPMIKESDLPAARDSRVPATVRTEELALISKELADANNLISNELADANVLLAKTTQASAELLAKTTQASAELLAKITQESADQLRKSNDISTKMMNRLTIILVAVGLIQIAVTAVAVFARSN
jgi:hypothetical protein